jgi:FkbM family methyltransferase
MPTFIQALSTKIFDCLYDNHQDNYDSDRYGPLPKRSLVERFRHFGKALFRRFGLYRIEDVFNPINKRNWVEWSPHFSALDWLYSTLNDADSKSLLVDLVAYHIMGARHIKLPLPSPEYWSLRKKAYSVQFDKAPMHSNSGGFDLSLQDFDAFGFPARLILPNGGYLNTFALEQYACPSLGVCAKSGDFVIDAGACWGDTAVYFAHKVGPKGKVFSFEFVPENLAVFRENLELNPDLAHRIEVVPHPIWSSSGISMGHSKQGPGAKVEPNGDTCRELPVSLSIDDFVEKYQVPRVDLIKMDIEGAEFDALKGAIQTISTHKPELAICVYHSKDDLTRLAHFIDSLNLGYRFALGHFTIHAEETVLFANSTSYV